MTGESLEPSYQRPERSYEETLGILREIEADDVNLEPIPTPTEEQSPQVPHPLSGDFAAAGGSQESITDL